MKYLIKNASVINEGEIFKADVMLDGHLIAGIARHAQQQFFPEDMSSGATVIDATGRYLIPGIIDEHVHFREPGLTHKASIATESRAAVAGGVTSFMDMPNTVPQTVTAALLEQKFDIASQTSLANYSFYLGATNDNIHDVLEIDTARVCGVKLFMGSSTGNMLVDKCSALETLFSQAPCLIAVHCEDEETIQRATGLYKSIARSGPVRADAALHPLVRSAEACFKSTARAVELAHKTGARLHILHISTRDELTLLDSTTPLRQKKITAETCPHYLYFDDSRYHDLGYAIKCNPAIKSASDRSALLGALNGGLIDTIATDHAPHLREEKFADSYWQSKSGFASVGHSLEIMYELSRSGYLTLPRMVQLMCHNPAILYSIDRRGFIREGYLADLALVDFDCCSTISNDSELSRCGWSPYSGCQVHSRVTHTFVNGNLVYENGHFNDESRGERLLFKPTSR